VRADLAHAREQYGRQGLSRADLDDDPFVQFQRWFDELVVLDPYDATAVALATADRNGRPSVRFVLLKGLDHGFVFFTNYESRKAVELTNNPQGALCFGWTDVERQVRVVGPVERTSEKEGDDYFAVRPERSQLAAWASSQSEPVADRAALEARFAEAEARFAGGPVPRPPNWGGFRLVPDELEFWQGRPDRLHDRFRYRRIAGAEGWSIERLMP